jgi:hypothetical protein
MVGKALCSADGLGVLVDEVAACMLSVGVGLMMPIFNNLLELDAPKTFCVGLMGIFRGDGAVETSIDGGEVDD